MKIAIGNDHAAVEMKEAIKAHLEGRGILVEDMGTNTCDSCDYPVYGCSEPYTARLSRMHNDSNVLGFGARIIGIEMAKMITDAWLDTEYEGGRHQRRVDQLMEIENR